jgi:group I intron endonuclease
MTKIVGIYKITSPSGRVYIGQSRNLEKRWKKYALGNSVKQKKLHNSFKKHGKNNHAFAIICTLPDDVDNETLTRYEQLYMDSYRDCLGNIMNVKDAGSSGKMSEESKRIVSEKNIGRKHKPETIELFKILKKNNKARLGMKNKPITEKRRKQLSEFLKANPLFKGRNHTEESKRKISLAKTGVKKSQEALERQREGIKLYCENKRKEKCV